MKPLERIVVSPGCLGGRLRTYNLILCALQARHDSQSAGSSGPEPTLVLDENLFGPRDLRLPVQNAHGDVVAMDIPDHGKFSHGSRAAFENALRDTVPLTAEVETTLAKLLPPALMTPLEAAQEFWGATFPKLAQEVVLRGAPSPPPTKRSTGITWGSARHFQTIKDLGLTPEQALEGEAACLARLIPVPSGELGVLTERLRESTEQHLAEAKPLAAQVDPSLVGAWARLRRNLRDSLDEFAERADRCGRNRGGIRRTRLHALAQALRPQGGTQEDGISLFSAMASFQLDPGKNTLPTTSPLACPGAGMLLRTF